MQLVGQPEGNCPQHSLSDNFAGVANSSLLLVKLPTGLYRQRACYENVVSTEIYYLGTHKYVGW